MLRLRQLSFNKRVFVIFTFYCNRDIKFGIGRSAVLNWSTLGKLMKYSIPCMLQNVLLILKHNLHKRQNETKYEEIGKKCN